MRNYSPQKARVINILGIIAIITCVIAMIVEKEINFFLIGGIVAIICLITEVNIHKNKASSSK